MASDEWKQLNADLSSMEEAEVLRRLKDEAAHSRRPTFLIRLHQRYAALRTQRERDELLSGDLVL